MGRIVTELLARFGSRAERILHGIMMHFSDK